MYEHRSSPLMRRLQFHHTLLSSLDLGFCVPSAVALFLASLFLPCLLGLSPCVWLCLLKLLLFARSLLGWLLSNLVNKLPIPPTLCICTGESPFVISVGVMPLVSMSTLPVFVLPLLPMAPMQRGQLTRAGCPLVSLSGPIFRPGPETMSSEQLCESC